MERLNAYQTKSKLPEPPRIDENNWAPSGMENLDAAFKWAITNTDKEKANLWKFYYGTWLTGRDKTAEAIKILSSTKTGVAKALLTRLLKIKGDMNGARNAFESI